MASTAPGTMTEEAASAQAIEDEEDDLSPLIIVTPEEGRRIFDEAARAWMGMSGEEFLRRLDAGEYYDIADAPGHRHIMHLAMMRPLAEQEP